MSTTSLPSPIFPVDVYNGGAIIDESRDTGTDASPSLVYVNGSTLNRMKSEINSIESELGPSASGTLRGSLTSLAARLAVGINIDGTVKDPRGHYDNLSGLLNFLLEDQVGGTIKDQALPDVITPVTDYNYPVISVDSKGRVTRIISAAQPWDVDGGGSANQVFAKNDDNTNYTWTKINPRNINTTNSPSSGMSILIHNDALSWAPGHVTYAAGKEQSELYDQYYYDEGKGKYIYSTNYVNDSRLWLPLSQTGTYIFNLQACFFCKPDSDVKVRIIVYKNQPQHVHQESDRSLTSANWANGYMSVSRNNNSDKKDITIEGSSTANDMGDKFELIPNYGAAQQDSAIRCWGRFQLVDANRYFVFQWANRAADKERESTDGIRILAGILQMTYIG